MAKPIRLPNAEEQQVLDHLQVRLISEDELTRWNERVTQEHYLGNATLVGEHLRYVVEYQGQWLALIGWSAPARHLAARDQWIGWSHDQLKRRRHFLANNARYCILADRQQLPNLGSRALALCTSRLSEDWQARWGHPIVAVESFVDGQLFRGTAYKAAGWTRLDDTSGFSRVAEDFYARHDRPKQLWVRALEAKALASLRAPTLPPALAAAEVEPPPRRPRCRVSPRRMESLLDRLPEVKDPRDVKGRWQPWRAVLGIIVLAKVCGTHLGQRHIAEFARALTKPQRRALGCRRDPEHPGRYVVPSESTFQRALTELDFAQFQPLLLDWQDQQLGADHDPLIAIDGKHLRSTGGLAMACAVGQPSQRLHASVTMKKDESEITAVRTLLAGTQFTGRLLALDSLHTQHETVHQILYDHGADYLVPLKDNQPTLLKTAQTLVPETFSPSGGRSLQPLPRRRDHREEPQPSRTPRRHRA